VSKQRADAKFINLDQPAKVGFGVNRMCFPMSAISAVQRSITDLCYTALA
jgi:hypothetical protein